MNRTLRAFKTWPSGAFVLALLFVAVSHAGAQDAVKLSGLWVQPVTVQSISKGQVYYRTQSGHDLARPLQSLEGFKLGRYPALGKAEDAIERGEDLEAVALLQVVTGQASEQWVRWYAEMRLVQTHARLDVADASAGLYIDMIVSGADLYYVALPPTDVVAQADAAVRSRVSQLASTAKGAVDPDRTALLQKLIDVAGNPSPDLIDAGPTHGPEPTGKPGGAPALTASVPPGSIVNLYRRGQYDLALRAADEALSQPGKTASKLYLKGMAQLAAAQQADGRAGYKSAGLSFMRVLVYFPRSAVAGPATLEAGYVHERIGRPEIAARLYERARPLIDELEDPLYYKRLNERIASVSNAPSGE
jgi:tetratricopeptide (TPR) repeat protein